MYVALSHFLARTVEANRSNEEPVGDGDGLHFKILYLIYHSDFLASSAAAKASLLAS